MTDTIRAPVRPVHASSDPSRTRVWVEPMLDRFGITRVADLTGLDELGVPVWAAYRPAGRTLAVSLGVSADPQRAWVGAVMESIEIWHTENLVLPARRARARDLGLPYDVRDLALADRSPLSQDTVLDWVPARGVLTGTPTVVPRGVVGLDFTSWAEWDDVLFNPTSNGTAVGATPAEATLHALLEVAERDATACEDPAVPRRPVDPDLLGSPAVTAMLRGVRAAGCRVGMREVTNALSLPTFVCTLWAPDMPVEFTGFGCHPDPATAAGRALAEAVLVRVGIVSGARDDIPDAVFAALAAPGLPAPPPPTGRPGPPGPAASFDDGPGAHAACAVAFAEATARSCADRIRGHTGCEPLVVDLTHPDIGIPALKVVAPGLRMLGES